MSPETSEHSFEDAIECGLLRYGLDACTEGGVGLQDPPEPWGDMPPGGYRRRLPEEYDRAPCLIPRDVVDFVLATQPKEWRRLTEHYGTAVRERLVGRLASEIERRGALDVLRNGIRDSGVKFQLAYFHPSSGLNEKTQRLHAGNLFAVVRQLRYSTKNEKSLDLVLFLNGIPIFTAELKNPLTGQEVENAIRQYKTDRDPREPLFAHGRCLAHFAVDPELVYVTTHLAGPDTRFLPFNRGRFGGAGNPPVPPTRAGYATAYLWEETWARDSALDLIRQFIHEVEEEDERGRKTGKRFLMFPRYQQLDCVRRLVAEALRHGAGQRYLIQHSAGSGKSFTIAWLAHRLTTLHDASDRRVFNSIIVVTDRRVLDRQLQAAMRQFEQTLGVVENINTTSRQLKEALESGKTIIVTTLQKFPVIAHEIGELPASVSRSSSTKRIPRNRPPPPLYEVQTRLSAFPVYTEADVTDFARVYFDRKTTLDQLYSALSPMVERFRTLSLEEREDFRSQLTDYVRLYAFLSQVLTFADPDLEKLYVFARHLRRLLPADRAELPLEVQQNIDMESYRIQQTGSGRIALDRKAGVLDPVGTKGAHRIAPEEMEALSLIIAELNERFGLNLGLEHKVTVGQMMERLDEDAALDAAARANTRENVRLTFDHKVENVVQEIVDSNFELYKRITNDRAFGDALKNFLFDHYVRGHRDAEELIKRGESKTLEFKSTLRWSLKEDRRDDNS